MNQCLCCGSKSLDLDLAHFCSYSCANEYDMSFATQAEEHAEEQLSKYWREDDEPFGDDLIQPVVHVKYKE